MKGSTNNNILFYIVGIIPVVWIALLIAPYINGGLPEIIKEFPKAMENPLRLTFCENSIKVSLFSILIYGIAISIYESTKKNYRRKEEHGSAKWGNTKYIDKKYRQYPASENKILTQNVAIGLDAKKHRRNLNVLVCGRKSDQARQDSIGKPNVMQCGENTSYVILDPKRRNIA